MIPANRMAGDPGGNIYRPHVMRHFSLSSRIIQAVCFVSLIWLAIFVLLPLPQSASGFMILSRQAFAFETIPWQAGDFGCLILSIASAIVSAVFYRGRDRIPILIACGLVLLSIADVIRVCAHGAKSHAELLSLALWASFFLASLLGEDERRKLFFIWVAMLGLRMVFAVIAYDLRWQPFVTGGFGYRATGLYGSPNILCYLCVPAIYAALALAQRNGLLKMHSFILYIIAMFSALALWLTFSRGAWLGFSAGLCVACVWSRRRRRPAILLLALGIALAAACIRTHGQFVTPGNDRSAAGHVHLWRLCLQAIEMHPIFGSGHGAFRRLHLSTQTMQPSNLYLNILLEFGAAGFLLYASFFFSAFRAAIQETINHRLTEIDRIIARTAVMMLIGMLIAGFTDTALFDEYSHAPDTAVFLVFIGLACAIRNQNGVEDLVASSRCASESRNQ